MLGISTYVPALWLSSLLFFVVNCWVLGIVVAGEGEGESGSRGLMAGSEKEERLEQVLLLEKTLKDEGVEGVDGEWDSAGDDDDDSDVEEITREQTVEEMVTEEMRRRRNNALAADSLPPLLLLLRRQNPLLLPRDNSSRPRSY